MTDSQIGTVTVMFTDLVGSTALRTQVGEDAAEALRSTHDALLSEVIGSNGGHVVKHLGDGLMATFTSSARALGAAVAIQQAIDLGNRRSSGERLQVRVGVSVGDVTLEGDDCFGLAVVEAQRLEASADPSTIRCAELVVRLARGRGGLEVKQLGGLHLKGLAEPLEACEILWRPVSETAESLDPGLPPVFHGGGLPLSGRHEVLEALGEHWSRCVAGGFEMVLLAGEAGVGKTRIARELATRVHREGSLVLAGRCDRDVALPFGPFGSALEWFVRDGSGHDDRAQLGDFPGDLVRLVPQLADLVPGLPAPLRDEPELERFRLFQAVGSWLAVGGATNPRLFVIDDLHWADEPSVHLLRQLSADHPAGLMVLCTYRDTDVDHRDALAGTLADLWNVDVVTRRSIPGLDADGVRELLTRAGGQQLGEAGLEFADLLLHETSGNPFFIGELLRHLTDVGAVVMRDGRWISELQLGHVGIPQSVREVVAQRCRRLGEPTEQMLRTAAVIGNEFDIDLLVEVVGCSPDDVLDALDDAGRANLVHEIGVGRHRFAHALVRETLHAELSASRRARQHRRVAEALERRHADDLDAVISELATHWAEASVSGDPTRAIECSLRAGDQASNRGAFESSISWYRRALELMGDDTAFDRERKRTTVKVAEARCYSGLSSEGRSDAMTAARDAIAAGDAETACDALSVASRSGFGDHDGADPERVDLLRDALRLPSLDVAQRAILLAELATELIFERDLDGRRAALGALAPLVEQLSPGDRGRVLAKTGSISFAMTRSEAVNLAHLQVEALEVERVPWRAHLIRLNRLQCALLLGDRETAHRLAVEQRQLTGGSLNRFAAYTLLHEAVFAVLEGDLAGAHATAHTMVRDMTALAMPEVSGFATTTQLMIGRERATLSALGRFADAALHMGGPSGAARAFGAFVRLEQGDHDAASAALALVFGEEFSDDAGYPIAVALWSEIAVRVGPAHHCRSLAERLAPQSGLHLATGGVYLGAVDRLLAMLHDRLRDHHVADELFAAAVAEHEDFRSPPWVARTRLDWAESLLNRGEMDRARVCVDAARSSIGDLDLPDNQRRLDDLTFRLDTVV